MGLPLPAPLRVAIVAPSLRILGGQAVQAQRLLDAWRGDREITAWLVPINPAPPRWLVPVQRIRFVRTLLTQLLYWPLLAVELRRADVVHVFSASYWSFLLAPLPAVVIARLLHKPVLINYRSGEAPDHLTRSRLACRVLRHVDRVVVPSRFLVDVMAGFGIRATVISNIVDLRRFAFRRRVPLAPRLLSTRNFEPMYNVACTVRAFARIQARHPGATLTLVGSGSDETTLRALVRGLQLRNVTFTGAVPPSEIERYCAEADIYVQSPRIDNMPSSVLEAFASGLPVVATGIGGVPAILAHEKHGLLVADDDDAALAAGVERLLNDPMLADRLATEAYASCQAYRWEVVRGQWAALYRELARAGVAAMPEVRTA